MRQSALKLSLLPIGLLLFIATTVVGVQLWHLRRVQLQNAADAAALGALCELQRSKADWAAAGKTDAAMNGFRDGFNGVMIVIENPPASGPYLGDTSAVQATITQSIPGHFLGFATRWLPTVSRSTVAKQGTNSNRKKVIHLGSSS